MKILFINKMTLKIIISFLFFFLLSGDTAAMPTGSIFGIVTDSTGIGPLSSVNIVILQTGQGTSTNREGRFEIPSVQEGRYTLEFSHVGYEKKIVSRVVVKAGERTRVQIRLRESYIRLDPVVIRGVRFRQLPEDTRTGVIYLRPESAQVLPGAVEDVMRTLQTMPGIVIRSDFSSQLVVRGSTPDQNLIVIDDIEVFNPYRLYGMISMFNPATIEEINLITGGFPARYGDRLSAVLHVINKEGVRDQPVKGNLNTNITNANIVLEGSAPFGIKGNWLVSARRTYYDLIAGPIARRLKLVEDDVAFPNFTDLQSKITIGPYDGHRLYFNALVGRDAVNIISGDRRPTPDSIAVVDQTDHTVFGTAWHYAPSNNFYSKVIVSKYRNSGDSNFEGHLLDPTFEQDGSSGRNPVRLKEQLFSSFYEFEKTSITQEIAYTTGSHKITGGSGIDFISSRILWRSEFGQAFKDFLQDLHIPLIDEFTQARRYQRRYGFLTDRWRVSDKFTIEPGIRLDYYSILENAYISPRLNASYALDDNSTVRGSIGRYLQSPGYEKIFGQSQFFDFSDRETVEKLHPEEAIHYVAGVDRWLLNSLYLRLEGYYKDFQNLISVDRVPGTQYIADPIPGKDQRYADGWTDPYPVGVDSVTNMPNNDASGESYGVELFLEKQSTHIDDPLSGWISYSYSIANRNQYGRTLPFDFDQRHVLNIVMHYRLSNSFEVGARWRYGSGFPHTPPVGYRPRYIIIEDDGETEYRVRTDSNGEVLFHIDRGEFSNRNTARLPDYSRIDVRFNWHTSIWGLNWLFYLDVINILNRKNVINYRYTIEDLDIHERATTMFPIIPTFGFSFRF